MGKGVPHIISGVWGVRDWGKQKIREAEIGEQECRAGSHEGREPVACKAEIHS